MRNTPAEYNSVQTIAVAKFVDELREKSKGADGTFDSAVAVGFLQHINEEGDGAAVAMPDVMKKTLDSLPEESHPRVMKAVLDGIAAYEYLHGCTPTADVVESAISQAYATTDAARKEYHLPATLDSATSAHHDQISLQPNRAVVAILTAMAEAIPVANYLPTDIGSNEAKLIIVSHTAASAYGAYALNALMDGVQSGDAFVTAQRVHTPTRTVDAFAGILTQIQSTAYTCDQAATAVKLLKGRAIVYVNGFVAGREVSSGGASASSAIVGTATIGGTDYAITGTINIDTGAIALSIPSLPGGAVVRVSSVIDYERSPGTIPKIKTNADQFPLYASPWKVNVEQSIDSRTQFANELGLDPNAESMLAVRNQFANERHYDVLRKAFDLGQNNVSSFDFAWSTFGQQKTRSQIWQDFSAVLGAASQKMAEDTIDHGITHLYVSKNIAANFLGMPSDLFEPSGITARPGIYRLGRLFGMYEVYYSPKVAVDVSATASTIIAIGRSTQVARCPFVLGDAVPPTVNPLAMDRDQIGGQLFYARQFTEVNPHVPSARGCAIINVTNLS